MGGGAAGQCGGERGREATVTWNGEGREAEFAGAGSGQQ
jgi:hypothetical protein